MGHHNEQEPNNAHHLNLQNLKAENNTTVNISQTDVVLNFRLTKIHQLMVLFIFFIGDVKNVAYSTVYFRHPVKICFNLAFIF